MVPTDSVSVTVFSYTGPFVDQLWPEAPALRLRLSSTRGDRYDKLDAKQRVLPAAALRVLEIAMHRCGHEAFRLSDVVSVTGEKPFWIDAKSGMQIDFSLSHTSGAVVVAVARGCRVGIDVEQMHAVAPKTIRRLMPMSARHLPSLDERNATTRWTQVEAVVKAAGVGIFRALDIEWHGAGEFNYATLNNRRWWWQPVDIGTHHVVHVATSTANAEVDQVHIEKL